MPQGATASPVVDGVCGDLQTAKRRLASAFPIGLYVPNITCRLIGSYWKTYRLRIFPLRNRFQFNNNRFKLLLQQPPIPQLRLTVLAKQGPKKVHARPASAAQQSIPATDRHTCIYMACSAVHQTKHLEADVSLSMLIRSTRTEGAEIE